MTTRKFEIVGLACLGVILIALAIWRLSALLPSPKPVFNGERAYQDVLTQMAFGPRTPGSTAHIRTIAWMESQLRKAGWQVTIQAATELGHPLQNVIANRTGAAPEIILGTHYDSRLLADQDPGPGRFAPVPGANDGASGVAVLLELARSLPRTAIPIQLVFFDAEDDGGFAGWDWLLGSRAFVASLTTHPRAAIILDMVGDQDLNIYMECNSNPTLDQAIWAQAAALGYAKQFIPRTKYCMLDDHTPFLQAGIPAVDIIDFDYPYWHTAADTADKVSAQSLQVVGRTVLAWLLAQK
ncbi:MAG: M28 family peptidase [Anaerolineales bacterium]|jgi:hypothetical protein